MCHKQNVTQIGHVQVQAPRGAVRGRKHASHAEGSGGAELRRAREFPEQGCRARKVPQPMTAGYGWWEPAIRSSSVSPLLVQCCVHCRLNRNHAVVLAEHITIAIRPFSCQNVCARIARARHRVQRSEGPFWYFVVATAGASIIPRTSGQAAVPWPV